MPKQRPLSDFELSVRKAYGDAIFRLRSTLGWSRKQLAACTSRSHSSIKDYEMNLAGMRSNVMNQIARAFNFSISRLFPAIKDAFDLKKYIEDIEVMNDEMQARVRSAGGWIEPPVIVKGSKAAASVDDNDLFAKNVSVIGSDSTEPSKDTSRSEENPFQIIAKLIDTIGEVEICNMAESEQAPVYETFASSYSIIVSMQNDHMISDGVAVAAKKSLIEHYSRGDVNFDVES